MGSKSSKVIEDPEGEVDRQPIPEALVVQTGTGLAWVVFWILMFALIILSVGIYGSTQTSPPDYEYYAYVSICCVCVIIICICITIYYTVVKSLQIEDIMITSIQRITLGDMSARDFQVRAGYYFKEKILKDGKSATDENPIDMAKYVGKAILKGLAGSTSTAAATATI